MFRYALLCSEFLMASEISRYEEPDDEGEGDEQEHPAQELLLLVLRRADGNLAESGVAEVEVGGEESEGEGTDAEGHLEAAATISDAPKSGLSRPRRFWFWKSGIKPLLRWIDWQRIFTSSKSSYKLKSDLTELPHFGKIIHFIVRWDNVDFEPIKTYV